jgi:hypothetical protein
MQQRRMSGATATKDRLTTLDSWLRSGIAAGPDVSGVGCYLVALRR